MGFSLDDLNPFDNGHVLDFSGNSTWQGIGNSLGLGSAPGTTPYAIDPSAFKNPLGNVAPQLGSALNGFTGSAYQPVQAAASPYTSAAGAGLTGVAGQYGQLASGQGPSLAVQQAQAQGASNLAQANSMLGSARGAGSPAAAQLASANALTQGQQQVAQNAVQGRTAEEMGALQGQAGALGALGGLGTTVSGQGNQVAQGNQAVNAQVQNQYLQALAAQNAQQQQGAMAGQQLGSTNQLGANTLQSNNANNQAGRVTGLLGAGLGAIGDAAK